MIFLWKEVIDLTAENKRMTEAQKRAHKKYMSSFVEIKVRMTPDKRALIQDHAKKTGESVTGFINRAIDEAMSKDNQEGGANHE